MGRKANIENPSSYTPEYYRQYYHKHNEYITCNCGKQVRKFGIYIHRKTKGHITILELERLNGLLNEKTKMEESLGENIIVV
jgi:hypothetical protein